MTQLGVGTILKNAFSVFFDNLFTAIFIAVVTGGLGFYLTDALGTRAAASLHLSEGKALLVVGVLIQSALLCVWSGVVGSWAAPAQIYLWVQREKKQVASLSGAINYGLNRMGRVMRPHFSAYGLIALGNIVIVPGVIFGLQFAFVDAIATLDQQERSPLSRSMRLTSARRGTIFQTMLVFFFGWWLWYQLGLAFLQSTMPWWGKVALGTVDHLVLILVDLAMVQIYLDLFRKPAEGSAPKLPSALPAGTNENPWAASSSDSETPRS